MGFPMAYLEYAYFVSHFNRPDEKIIYFLNAYDKGERKIASGILAKLYFFLRQYDQAIHFAEEAISLGDISLNVTLGHLYKEKGDLIIAEKYFLKYPSKSLFDFYVDQKRFHDAIRYFDKDKLSYKELVLLVYRMQL